MIVEDCDGSEAMSFITPNGDGINDRFFIVGNEFQSVRCTIFNRWGKKIYEWSDVNGYWDGTYNGTLVSDGTYYYIAEVVMYNGSKRVLRGYVEVIK